MRETRSFGGVTMDAHLMGIGSHWDPERPSEPEIREFKIIALIDEKILRL
jgi:hypothetical protein